MSKEVDERVVSMQFDNKHFEKNVSTTMSTLDKLKQALHFKGASKGIDDTTQGMSGIGTAVQTVSTKFSAMQVMVVTALANITNSAVNAGKRIVSALTIDPVKTGFQEYETQINAVQTILANTESKGSTLEDVNRALEQLNKYADMTIYNFTEMTRNIGTFTAAGVDLETSVQSIKGIANLAAVSGSTSQQAATAMYQLSQALSSGTVKLMDWNSVVNAGMGGQVFQDALKETARVHGVAIDAMIDKEGSFRETLSQGWLTADILTETLEKFTMATEGLTEAEIEANRVKLRGLGYTEEQIEQIFKLGNTATNAATKVKTFTQLWDVLKEAAQSGWSQSWKIIVGDFEEAKNLLTPLSDTITGIINKMSDWRNAILESALGTKFADLTNLLSGPAKAAEKATASLEYYQDIVNRVWRGDFKNQPYRYDLLDEAGYNHAVVQSLVDKGYQYKLTIEDINEAIAKWGNHGKNIVKINGEVAETQEEVNEVQQKTIEQLLEMSDAELLAAGYAQEQIDALREVSKWAKAAGVSIADFLKEPEKYAGRTMLIDSFKELGKVLGDIAEVAKAAWQFIFPPKSTEEWAFMIYGWIGALKQFTSSIKDLVIQDGELTDTGDKLFRTFSGLFSLFDIIYKLVGGGFRLAFEAVKAVLGLFNIDVLSATAAIGDAITAFNLFLEEVLSVTAVIEWMAPAIRKVVDFFMTLGKAVSSVVGSVSILRLIDEFKAWIEYLKTVEDLPKAIVDGIIGTFGRIGKFIGKIFGSIGSTIMEQFGLTGGDFASGFATGISNGIKTVLEVIYNLGVAAIEALRNAIDSHSDSKETIAIGNDYMSGFITGLLQLASMVWETILTFGRKCVDILKELDFGKVIAGFVSGGMTIGFVNIAKAIWSFADTFEGLADVFEQTGDVLKQFKKTLKAYGTNLRADALKSVAIAIGILVASIVVLAMIPAGKLWASIGALAVLAGILVGVSAAIDKFGAGGDMKGFLKFGSMIMSFSFAVLIMAAAIKLLETVDAENVAPILWTMCGVITAMLVLCASYMQIARTGGSGDLDKAGTAILKIGAVMLLMAVAIKIIADCITENPHAVLQAVIVVGAFGALIVGLMAATKLASGGQKINTLGATIAAAGGAILMMAVALKLVVKLASENPGALWQAVGVITIFGGIIAGLLAVTKFAGGGAKIKNLGSTLAAAGAAILLMSISVGIIAGLVKKDPGALWQAVGIITVFAGIITGLIAATKLAGKNDLKRVGTTLLMVSVAIGILAAVAVLLSLLNPADLAKGVIAVGFLASFMAGLILVTKYSKNCSKTLIPLIVAIGLLATAVIALSFIDPKKLIAPTIAMGLLMGMLALVVAATGKSGKAMANLIVLAGIVALFAGILYLMSGLPVQGTIGSAVALAILMGAMAGVVAILSVVGSSSKNALLGAVALLALAVPLMAFVGVLAVAQLIQNATANALLLVGMAYALTLLMIPLAILGIPAVCTAALLGIAALTSMAIPLLTFIGVLAVMQNIQNAEANINLLLHMMGSLTAMLFSLSLVAPLAILAVTALTMLTGLIVYMTAFVVVIGALTTWFEDIQTFVDAGIPLMIQLAGGLGSMIGAFVANIALEVAQTLPTLGSCLSDFMINAEPFITIAKSLDWSVAEGAAILAASVIALTTADLIAGVSSFLQGGSSFATLGLELSAFMLNAMPFITGAQAIKPGTMESINELAQAILILTAADVLDGLTSWFTGGSSLTAFGAELAGFGPHLAAFAESVSGLDEHSLNAMKTSAESGKLLAEMAKTFPNSGGWLGAIFGENDADTFGAQLEGLGKSLMTYGKTVQGIEKYIDSMNASAEAGKALTELADSIPNSGGFLGDFLGDNTMDGFGTQLEGFGKSLIEYGKAVTGVEKYTSSMEAAVTAGKALTDLADAIPNSGGFLGDFIGDNTMDGFGAQLEGFGNSLMKYGETVSGIADYTGSITASITAAEGLTAISKAAKEAGKWDAGKAEIVKFGDNIVKFGESMASYGEKISGINIAQMTSATTQFKRVVDIASGLVGIDSTGLGSFGKNLEKLGEAGINKFIAAFTNAKSRVETVGKGMVNSLIIGVKDASKSFTAAFKALTNNAIAAIKSNYQQFYSVGGYLVSGFANGITANTYKAQATAVVMARVAHKAAAKELQEKSPSKIGYEIGDFFGVAFVNGIADNISASYDTSTEMASYAKQGLTDAIKRISNGLNSDMDFQPTIRPVLDLSDVRSGAGMIGSLFDTNPAVGVMANVRAINSMMNRQNGANDDVISAINSLGKKLGEVGGTQYNINGVSVDEDEAVVDAVKTIVRAARMERRV